VPKFSGIVKYLLLDYLTPLVPKFPSGAFIYFCYIELICSLIKMGSVPSHIQGAQNSNGLRKKSIRITMFHQEMDFGISGQAQPKQINSSSLSNNDQIGLDILLGLADVQTNRMCPTTYAFQRLMQ
jgi:hypothetical protein